MNKEHEQGIRAFENCLQSCKNLGHELFEMHFERVGITEEGIKNIKAGKQFLTEEQFYGFVNILRAPMQLDKPLINWLYALDHWALVGILEPLFSLKKHNSGEVLSNIRAILDFPYIVINNPELCIAEEDSLLHRCPHGSIEELFISEIDYSPYSNGRKPIYTLTVARSKRNMSNNTNNFNIGGNLQMEGNAHLNAGNVTDNSSNASYELPPDFFVQTRETLESITSIHKQELLDLIEKIESAKLSANKIAAALKTVVLLFFNKP